MAKKKESPKGPYLLFIVEDSGCYGVRVEETFVGRFDSINSIKKAAQTYIEECFEDDSDKSDLSISYYDLFDNTWHYGTIVKTKFEIKFN